MGGSRLRSGEVFAYVGSIQNLKDLKAMLGELNPQGLKGGSPFSHSPRAICTVLLDPRDPSLQSERTQGFAADPVYGRAKCLPMLGSLKT